MKLLEHHFDTAFDAPDGIKKLRELILTLAMQGKLVPQDPNDPPASELLKEIKAEEKRLIKEGKIKEPKPLPKVTGDEVPYTLPKGWQWVRLGSMGSTNIGLTYSPSDVSESGIPVLRSNNIQSGMLDLSNLKRVAVEVKQSVLVQEGDLLICARNGSRALVGKTAMIPALPEAMAFGAFMAIFRSKINPFLLRFINSPLFREMIDEVNTVTINQITQENLRSTVFPLPPLNEQSRIIAKIDELMARCDALEKLRTERDAQRLAVHTTVVRQLLNVADTDGHIQAREFLGQNFGELYTVKENVTELRKAILQLAVMGKLVPQDSNDPPASVLLKQIEVEKKRLVKEGKIKEPKPLLMITAEEIPFELSAEWAWIRFFAVNDVKSELVSASDFPDENQIAPDSIEKGTGRLLFNRSVSESGAIGPNNRFYKGQILYSKIRPSLNKVTIAPYDGLCSADMYPINTYVNSAYMHQVMLSEVFLEQVRLAENRVKMPKLNLESLSQFVIPLAPLAEQHRIVAKIDQLMSMCDTLEQQIDAAGATQSALLAAMMAQYGGQQCA